MIMYTIEHLNQLKNALILLNHNKSLPELSPELIHKMAIRWINGYIIKNKTIEERIEDLVKYRAYPQVCGCLGARDDWPWCPCEVDIKYEQYRIDVAIYIVEHLELFNIDQTE